MVLTVGVTKPGDAFTGLGGESIPSSIPALFASAGGGEGVQHTNMNTQREAVEARRSRRTIFC